MLLCTRPSSTLSLLTGAFGMEIATSLHEVSMDDGNFKLFGYISGPCDNLTIKVELLIQYRFNCYNALFIYYQNSCFLLLDCFAGLSICLYPFLYILNIYG